MGQDGQTMTLEDPSSWSSAFQCTVGKFGGWPYEKSELIFLGKNTWEISKILFYSIIYRKKYHFRAIFRQFWPFLSNFGHTRAILTIFRHFLPLGPLKNTSELSHNLFYSIFNRKKTFSDYFWPFFWVIFNKFHPFPPFWPKLKSL